MATNGALIVKAYLEKNGDAKAEIRRFQVPAGSKDLYAHLVEKVSRIFSLPHGGFRLFWQDADGDFVTFSSTMELMEALKSSTEDVLRLYIHLNPSTSQDGAAPQPSTSQDTSGGKKEEEKVYHCGVICDGCEQGIYGPRYKCIVCPDFDLCSVCEEKGLHPEHDKFKITHPGGGMALHFRRWMHRFMRKCHTAHQNPTCGGIAEPGRAVAPEKDEYLKDVGENIRAFLDPFGIDVSYEVRHDTPNPSGFMSWGMFGQDGSIPNQCPFQQAEKPSKQTEEKKPKEQRPEEKPEEEAAEKQMEKAIAEEREVPIVMEEALVEPTLQTDGDQRDVSPARSHDEDWTMVQDGEVTGASGTAPREGLYPNLKVAQAVEMMKAMGFTDEGGRLTRLLVFTDGDIAKALDNVNLSNAK